MSATSLNETIAKQKLEPRGPKRFRWPTTANTGWPPLRVARALQAGTVWINDWTNMHDEFEEGGFKQSGWGRLRRQAGLDDFLECKHIAFKLGTIKR
jgi:hypothetical protein